ncbi:MAG: PaaI family thioesterase [Acidobacteriota bacterium]
MGWEAVQPFPASVAGRSFVSGPPTSRALQVAWFRRVDDGVLFGKVWFGPETLGPPGNAHGGSQAAVLDEAMGAAAWLAGHRVLAGRLEVDFVSMVPLGEVARVEARVVEVERRKVHTEARLSSTDGTVRAEARGLFVELSEAQLDELIRTRS